MESSKSASTVLVAGATGFLGTEICRQLIDKNKKVKGLVRTTSDPAKVDRLKEMGVETVTGDLKDKGSIIEALNGVSAVISTASSTISRQEGDSIQTVDEEGQTNLVNAAAEAGVDRFVFISVYPMQDEMPLQDAKRNVEKLLVESGLNYTILQPTYFMEIWLGPALGFDYQHAKATIYGEGNNPLSWISLQDVASFAVSSLDNGKAQNRIFELGGPEALSPNEVVHIFEKVKKENFELKFIPEEGLTAQKEAAQDPLSKSFASLMLSVAHGNKIDMKDTLKVFPMKLMSVSDYANSVGISA
jgi:uncharacterized protein YbjT (DUF2867 family)